MEKYGIGLDMGVASCGWVIVDEDGKVKRVRGKDAIGVRLFDEGTSASERRTFRGSRRRYKRRKWRLRFLRTADLNGTNFENEISKIDDNFFARMRYFGDANYGKRDDPSNHGYCSYLLGDERLEKQYHEEFPTIYHLRHALATEKKQFDIRLVYLAIHHIVKYRGNFLVSGNAKDFKNSAFDWSALFKKVNRYLTNIYPDISTFMNFDQLDATIKIAKKPGMNKSDRKKQMINLLFQTNTDKTLNKQAKAIFTEFIKAIVGSDTVKFNELLGIETTDDANIYKFSCGDIDDHMDVLDAVMDNEDKYELLNCVRKLYAEIKLTQILPSGMSLSEKMIQSYNRHHDELTTLRQFIKVTDNEKAQALYDSYIDDNMTNSDFVKQLEKVLKSSDNVLAKQIQNEIDTYKDTNLSYMPKQRSGNNVVVPYQVHQIELDDIIRNQSTYYPWLAATNPVENMQSRFPYKLDQLVGFRIPYYVGPLIEGVNKHSPFAWMSKKSQHKKTEITPWNFNDVVDIDQSADDFIKRLTVTDSYLIGEDVLPDNSLLYQKFKVLNELNKISLVQNGDTIQLKLADKKRLFDNVFKHATKKTIKAKDIIDNLINSGFSGGVIRDDCKVKGLSNGDTFSNSLSTYHDLKAILGNLVDDKKYYDDLEQIVAWSTTFEDSRIFAHKLQSLDWLTDDQVKKLSTKRYRGWGRVSKKLLTKINNEHNQSIIDVMWNTKKNFMQAVRDNTVQAKLEELNNKVIEDTGQQDVINNLYTSPQNKRSIKQCLLVVKDIVKAMHHQKPSWIFIEVAHDKKNTGRTKSRKQQLLDKYKVQSILKNTVDGELNDYEDRDLQQDKLYLYFEQNGIDVYTGKKIDNLENYQIDHILPQSIIKDDSLDNRVLVSSPINNGKGAHLASQKYDKFKYLWRELHEAGLMSSRKLKHLLMTQEEFNSRTDHFIARQLVETRQVIKLVTKLLADQYPDAQIVQVKANLSKRFRTMFGFPKLRNVNDYHHAFDAYLAAFMGRYLLLRHKGWQRFFVYGDYPKTKLELEQQDGLNKINIMSTLKYHNQIKGYDGKHIIWNQEADLEYMHELYDEKQNHYLVTHRTHIDTGALYKQTVYKAKEDKNNPSKLGNKKLIPLKKNKPTNIYGGYTEEQVAAYMLVRYHDKKKSLKLLSIPTRYYQLPNVKDLLEQRLGKTFDVLVPCLPKEQSYRDIDKNGKRRYFRIAGDYRDEQQLYMPLKYQFIIQSNSLTNYQLLQWFKIVKENVDFSKYLDDQQMSYEIFDNLKYQEKIDLYHHTNNLIYNDIYRFISKQMQQYFGMFSDTYTDKLIDNYEIFTNLSLEDKKSVIIKLLIGLHSDGRRSKIDSFSTKFKIGRLQFRSPETINKTLQIVHTSPTGLFQRIIKISDLD